MDEMLSIDEILSLIDREFGYTTEDGVTGLFEQFDVPASYRHLLSARTILRYFEDYAEKLGVFDYTTVIHTNNLSTKGVRYDKQDIMKVIYYPDIKARIEKQLMKKSKAGISGRIPSCIYREYLAVVIGDGKVTDDVLIAKTGMTKRQLDLLSVPDELLLQRRSSLEDEIQVHENLLQALKSERSDIDEELNCRSITSSVGDDE